MRHAVGDFVQPDDLLIEVYGDPGDAAEAKQILNGLVALGSSGRSSMTRRSQCGSWSMCGTDDRLVGNGQFDRVQDERPGLRAAEPAVERDQLFECAALFEVGVVEAVDHDVGDMLECVGARRVRGGVGARARVGSCPSIRPVAR